MARLAAAGAGGIVAATTMRACTQSQSAPPSSDNLDVDGVGGRWQIAVVLAAARQGQGRTLTSHSPPAAAESPAPSPSPARGRVS